MKRSLAFVLSASFLVLSLAGACNNSVDDMLDNYNGGFEWGYATVDSGEPSDDDILQPGDQGFDEKKMLRDEYFLGYDMTLNLYAPRTSEIVQWFICDPDDMDEEHITFHPHGNDYAKGYQVGELTTQTFSLYAEDSGLDNGTTYKLTLNVWKGGKKYSDWCSLVVYKHYEWNQ